jgi:NADP-reducing hydrogenase subunit HndD
MFPRGNRMKISMTVNGQVIEANQGQSVLEVLQDQNVDVPTLCYLKDLNDIAACRMCVAEVNGSRLQTTCTLQAADGMVVNTETERVHNSRKQTLELLASYHSFDCWTCPREKNCDLFDQMRQYNVDDVFKHSFELEGKELKLNQSLAVTLDSSKCVHCSSCIAVCDQIAGVGVLEYMERGYDSVISPVFGKGSLDDVNCIGCGLCTKVCPTAAIVERDHIKRVEAALEDPNIFVVAQIDPAVRAAIGEEFGYDIGTPVETYDGQIFAAIQTLGFNDITTTNLAQDFAVLESANELLQELTKAEDQQRFPLFSSCSAGWIRYAEQNHPEMLDHISTAKAPHMMQGSFIKHFIAKDVYKVDPTKLFIVTISPCTAHKSEADRDDMVNDGLKNVDAVITTRELSRMIQYARIDIDDLTPITLSSPLDKSANALAIPTVNGGLMEQIIRTAKQQSKESFSDAIVYETISGHEGLLKASVSIQGTVLTIASAQGGKGMQDMMDYLAIQEANKAAGKPYEAFHYVEFMGCPGGCINGGGQPILREEYRSGLDITTLRRRSIEQSIHYKSDYVPQNELVTWYQTKVQSIGSPTAKRYLHTTYQDKSFINK